MGEVEEQRVLTQECNENERVSTKLEIEKVHRKSEMNEYKQ
jgi:hypothetical protein